MVTFAVILATQQIDPGPGPRKLQAKYPIACPKAWGSAALLPCRNPPASALRRSEYAASKLLLEG